LLLELYEMELATERCVDAASETMGVCEDDADDEIEGSYGSVLCEAIKMEAPMT
jgi:hypothetical protein